MTKYDRHKKFAEEEEKKCKSAYHVVLHEDDFKSIADRVCDSMSEPITAITTV